MNQYKITIEKVVQKADDRFTSDIRLYEQIIDGDESIISAVVGTVLAYVSNFPHRQNTLMTSKPLKESKQYYEAISRE